MYALTKSAVLFCVGVIVQSREIQASIRNPVLGIAVFRWSSNHHSSVMLKRMLSKRREQKEKALLTACTTGVQPHSFTLNKHMGTSGRDVRLAL